MRVWRVENAEGVGPYQSVGSAAWRSQPHDDIQHPTPAEDGIHSYYRGKQRCGFASIQQLKDWFTLVERETLQQYGFCAVTLEVRAGFYEIGSKQIVFSTEGIVPGSHSLIDGWPGLHHTPHSHETTVAGTGTWEEANRPDRMAIDGNRRQR